MSHSFNAFVSKRQASRPMHAAWSPWIFGRTAIIIVTCFSITQIKSLNMATDDGSAIFLFGFIAGAIADALMRRFGKQPS